MNAKQQREKARRIAKSVADKARYESRRMEAARQAGIKARNAEEAQAALEARAAERAEARREYDALAREQRRIDNERWRREAEERDARQREDTANMTEARASQVANGDTRAYCLCDVSSGVRCWLLPGHAGRCQAEPPRPVKGRGGRVLTMLMLAIAAGSL